MTAEMVPTPKRMRWDPSDRPCLIRWLQLALRSRAHFNPTPQGHNRIALTATLQPRTGHVMGPTTDSTRHDTRDDPLGSL